MCVKSGLEARIKELTSSGLLQRSNLLGLTRWSRHGPREQCKKKKMGRK